MTECVPRDTTGTKVFCGGHTTCGHDAHERIEVRRFEILNHVEPRPILAQKFDRTTHLFRDEASAPEVDTSKVNPFRFSKTSCSFSKFVLGGGI